MRKALLPKREPPVSSGGHSFTRVSAWSSTASSASILASFAASEDRTEEIEVSRTESERVKTKLTIRSCVGEARKRSWSRLERTCLAGLANGNESLAGGCRSAGVGGGGFEGRRSVLGRRRGVSLGSLSDRSGGLAGI